MRKFRRFGLIVILIFIPFSTVFGQQRVDFHPKLSRAKIASMEQYIQSQMRDGKIPGLAVVVVTKGEVSYVHGFGYADLKTKKPVTPQTMFELASNSKAFTALGIYRLQEEGLLNCQDPVRKYLPWFQMTKGEKTDNLTIEYLKEYIPWFRTKKELNLTIEQLLHQTSGMGSELIADLHPSEKEDALTETAKILMKKELQPVRQYYPGEQFIYSTVNYDILGLLIATISGKSYENYLKNQILIPLGLKNTCLFRKDAKANLATGYKIGFLRLLKYNAPVYRGNTPAGYIISNAEDMGRWLKIQLGSESVSPFFKNLIVKTHSDTFDYTNGWFIWRTSSGDIYFHNGINPNYASFIEFRPQQNFGVVLLANSNSDLCATTGLGISAILQGEERVPEGSYDMNLNIDRICVLLLLILFLGLGFTIYFIWKQSQECTILVGLNKKNRGFFVLIHTLLVGCLLILYFLPDLLIKYNWSSIIVWAPITTPLVAVLLFLEIMGIYLYLMRKCLFQNKKILQNGKKKSAFFR